jgi:CDP-diacylglycerol---glycerol-3-phosphate 3-phosphatidyltransferase
MPSIYDVKPKFQALLRPGTGRLARLGVTANQVTLLAAGLSITIGGLVCIYADARWPLLLIPVVLLIRMMLNAIDGMLAREHQQQTQMGAMLNELGDVISDSVIYLPLAFVAGLDPHLIVGIVVLAVISEMTGVVAVQIGASRRYDGPMGKSDRAMAFGAITLLLGLGLDAGRWTAIVLWLILVGLIFTVFNRARGALREIARAEKP